MNATQFFASSRILFPSIVFLFFTLALVAQSPQILVENTRSDMGGRNSIAGTVRLPAGTAVKTRIRVRLSTPGAEVSTMTDEFGKFFISGLKQGTYTLYIDPDGDLESDSQRIEISDPAAAPNGQVYTVEVRLRKKATGVASKPGTLNAELSGIPNRAVQLYMKGLELSAKGDNKGAVESLLRALIEHPDFMLAHSELGVQYQKLNNLEKADEHLLAALKIKPDAYEPLANRGIVLVRLRKYAEAEPVLRAAIKLKEQAPVVHFYLGRSLLGQKRPDDAEPVFRAAYVQGGNDMIEARRALATIYLERGENQKALEEIEAYLAGNPTAADEKHLRETIRQLKEWLKVNPKP
ncbi:MAG TPA: tetratricopeptide repeat protein [Pyrinomonadaceae bacterium]|nr:tetratricopeptide repeat protein [Pyrinomonadaceae bacterium]